MAILVSNESFSHRNTQCVYGENGGSQSITTEENVYIDTFTPVDDDVYLDIGFNVTKAKEDEMLVSGWANVALDKDGNAPFDYQGDVIEPEVLEKAAVAFMLEYRESGEMHKGASKGTVVESIVFTKEKQQAIGIPEGTVPEGWFITVKLSDAEAFAKVKDGTYKMFSIQGKAKRVEQ